MPTGYKFSNKQGRWKKIEKTQGFDYENVNAEATQFWVSFFRAFPDRLLDLIESPNADFTLAFPQRVILRSMFHYQKSVDTSSRGLGKTYLEMLFGMLQGVLYPGEIMRQYAPSQKQGAELASKAFHQVEKNYPALAALWRIKSETKDSFIIVTDFGSEYAIGAIQGGNCHKLIIEEIGQETEPKFDFADYESKVMPTCRLGRKISKVKDRTHISPHYIYITNASRRQNPAYTKYRHSTLKAMRTEPRGKAWAVDIGWEMSVLFGIRDKGYIEEHRGSMTHEDFLKQFCAIYTGSGKNPIVSDEDLSASRTLMRMESKHCGDPNAIYIVGHDVSYEDGKRNAKCADVVMKLTPFNDKGTLTKRDKYLKDIVWVDSYPPPKDHVQAAIHLKDLWLRFTMEGGQKTWIAIDSWQYGNAVMRELIKPMGDGINLCTYKHLECPELEGEHPLEVIYPVKAGGTGVRDNDFEMVRYMRVEYEQGNIRHLTYDIREGVKQYKDFHHIKDDNADGQILKPYYKTNELCEQIQNLQVVESGASWKEKRVSLVIQRDDWSAEKYCGRVAKILEEELARSHTKQSSWSKKIEAFKSGGFAPTNSVSFDDVRSNLLAKRGR